MRNKRNIIYTSILLANLLVVLAIRNWSFVSGVLFPPSYSWPKKQIVEKEASIIAEALKNGNVDFIIENYDFSAASYLSDGHVSEVSFERREKKIRQIESGLRGLKDCTVKKIDYYPDIRLDDLTYDSKRSILTDKGDKRPPTNTVVLALVFADGKEEDVLLRVCKKGRSEIVISKFSIFNEDNMLTESYKIFERK